jgi:crotonobetainyl-CoA:carnitine CoA-transferase CaiB-like acyl-CoA transferase
MALAYLCHNLTGQVVWWWTRPRQGGAHVTDRFLGGTTVLELGDGVAGGAAGSVLASLGAEVTTVVRPGASLHRLRPAAPAASGAPGAPGESMLAVMLRAGKRTLAADASVDPDGFDVVIDDRCDTGVPAAGASVDRYGGRNGTGAWVTISPYGLTGPRSGRAASNLTVGAAGGLLSGVTDPVSKRPLEMAGQQAYLIVGHAGALAACHGVDLSRRLGRPVQIDLSAQEAVIAMGPVLGIAQAMMGCAAPGGAARFGAPAGLFRCRDGYVHIMAMEDHQWQALVAVLGKPEWTTEFADPELRITRAGEVCKLLEKHLAGWGKREAEERLQDGGVPATAMYGPADLVEVAQFRHRGAIQMAEWDGVQLPRVHSPFLIETTESTGTTGPGPTRGIAGLEVAEIGHVLAVPLAGALLGAMGARVTKLEDPDRLDMYRRRGPYIEGLEGLEGSAYFAYMNHSKRSALVAMDDPGQLEAAIAGADVVIENLGPRRARRLGVDAAGLSKSRPGTLSVSSSGFGHTGPWSAYRVYAYNVHTCCGLAYLTRTATGVPPQIDVAWADLISGYALATVIAAWAVGTGGRQGAAVDFSMVELAVGRFNEFLAAASIPDHPDEVIDGAAPFSPHGVYRTAVEGRWIAVSVATDEQWSAFCRAVGDPAVLGGADYAKASSRVAHRRELDRLVDDLLSSLEPEELERSLQDGGVAASVVASAEQLVRDPHLAEREFFRPVEHPLWGRRHLIGLPWRLAGEAPFDLGPPPRLGESEL